MSEDIHNFKGRLEKTSETILSSEDFNKEDNKDLRNFYHYLIANNRNAGRIIKYLYHLKTMAKMFGKPFKTIDKDGIVELMSKVSVGKRKDGADWSENTKRDFRVIFKRYYQWLKGYSGSEYPSEVKWIQTWLKNKVTKKPEDILTQEEIVKLADGTNNIRDKAFILTIGESGLRIGEFLPLKIKNLEFNDDGCDIKIISEKSLKARTVPIYTSVPALTQWLSIHPYKNDPEAYVWTNPNSEENSHLAYAHILRVIKELGKDVVETEENESIEEKILFLKRNYPVFTALEKEIIHLVWSFENDDDVYFERLAVTYKGLNQIEKYSGLNLGVTVFEILGFYRRIIDSIEPDLSKRKNGRTPVELIRSQAEKFLNEYVRMN